MNVEVYYFSGTGNSLVVARDIAAKTNGKLTSISSVMEKESIETSADVIGIVFPVYYATNDSGVPFIIGRFVRKLENVGSKYIFAVCTHGGTPGTTIENIAKIIKSCGGRLAAGFTVKMGISYSAVEKMGYSLFHRELEADVLKDNEKQRKMSDDWEKELGAICEYVNDRKTGRLETRGTLRKLIIAPSLHLLTKPLFSRRYRRLSNSPRHLPFSELVFSADRSFQVNEKCSGCGVCVRVCPVNDIKIVNGRPMWQHHCENCFACFQWCPEEAIHGGIVEYAKRYHHPDVTLSDMLNRN